MQSSTYPLFIPLRLLRRLWLLLESISAGRSVTRLSMRWGHEKTTGSWTCRKSLAACNPPQTWCSTPPTTREWLPKPLRCVLSWLRCFVVRPTPPCPVLVSHLQLSKQPNGVGGAMVLLQAQLDAANVENATATTGAALLERLSALMGASKNQHAAFNRLRRLSGSSRGTVSLPEFRVRVYGFCWCAFVHADVIKLSWCAYMMVL